MAPRYDVPKAAPAPLRLVQEFVNTVDLQHDREWLAEWLKGRGARPTPRNLARAAEVREALRELLRANNGRRPAKNAIAALDSAARAGKLTVDFARRELRPEAHGLEGVLGKVLVVAFAYQLYRDAEMPNRWVDPERLMTGVVVRDDRTAEVSWSEPYFFAGLPEVKDLVPLPSHLLEDLYNRDKQALINSPFWSSTDYVGAGPYL